MELSLLIIPVAGLVRSLAGWLENAWEDKKIELPEWQLLGATIFRTSIPILGLMYGFNLDVASASGIGIFTDWVVVKLYNAIKKKK